MRNETAIGMKHDVAIAIEVGRIPISAGHRQLLRRQLQYRLSGFVYTLEYLDEDCAQIAIVSIAQSYSSPIEFRSSSYTPGT